MQTWLNTARQRAIRDKVPSGLRFLAGNSLPSQVTNATSAPSFNAYYVTRMVYLEGGLETVGTLYGGPGSTNTNTTTFTTSAALPDSPPFTSNDSLVINEGLPHQISSAGNSSIMITGVWPTAISKSNPCMFRIVRGPTTVTSAADGDNILTMPRGACVNFDPATTLTNLYPSGIDLGNYSVNSSVNLNFVPKANFNSTTGLDIMFAPDGTVMSPTSSYPIVFWVSGTGAVLNANGTIVLEAMRGQPQLVAVYPKTGQVVGYTAGIDVLTTINKANAMGGVL